MKKDLFIILGIVLFSTCIYGLTLRGNVGNPTADEFKGNLDQATQPFELSPERGRYVQVANMAETGGTYNLTKTWADIAAPDVGISSEGKYDSYFAPGVSYFALPFYLIGERVNLAQVASFSSQILVSIITLVFIYLIGRKIFKLPRWSALFAVLLFGFASTSWGYTTTLYEHAFSAMFEVTAFYAAWRFAQRDSTYAWMYASYVWFAYALSITINYPDAVLMLPIMIYLAISTFQFKTLREGIALTVRWSAIATFVVFMFITGLHFWHNATYYGSWKTLAGELKGYRPTATTTPEITHSQTTSIATTTLTTNAAGIVSSDNKSAVGFFHEKNIPKSFSVLIYGDERGLFFFSPVFLLSLLGIIYVFRKKEELTVEYIVPIALIVVNIFLYSSWGDPWGGWAYGPRYLIQSIPWLALFVSITITRGNFTKIKKGLAFFLFLFSTGVALLGALTSNAVPPRSEAVLLPVKTYNYLHDIPLLLNNESSSFVYKTYLTGHISLVTYFLIIYLAVVVVAFVTLVASFTKNHE